eukprot:160351_1
MFAIYSEESMSEDDVSCEATTTEMNRTLNLSHIMENIETYSKNQEVICDLWTLDNLQFKITIYPQAVTDDVEDAISIYLQVVGGTEKEHKFHKVQFTMKCADKSRGFIRSIEKFKAGRGWQSAIKHVKAEENPIIHFNIKLYHYPLFTKLPSQSFEKKLEKVHLLSQTHGDITLIVKLNHLDENKLDNFEPPSKKRKLNETFQCNVCDKTFGGQTALRSHQANKKDEAHRNFKNNTNNPIEIKTSSIILRASSNVFDRILSVNMREKEENKIAVYAKSVKDVKDLLYFMTTNKLKSDGNALNIIELAHYYEMDGLFWKCVNKMLNNISIDNFARTINTFDKYEIKKGYSVLVDFAKKNKDELEDADDFDTIPHSFKCAVLNIDESDDD